MPKSTYSRTTINVQGDEQEAFEVYADESREQTIGFCFTEEDACRIGVGRAMLDVLEDAAMDLQTWLEGATPGEDFPETRRIIESAEAIIALAKP